MQQTAVEQRGALAAAPAGPPDPIQRKAWGPGPRFIGRILAWLVLWPVTRVLGWFGIFPRLFVRLMNRRLLDAEPFVPAANDVLVASYFKSGTNWTMQTTLQIAHRAKIEFEHIHDFVPWYELPVDPKRPFAAAMDDERVRFGAERGLRVIKTHLSLSALGYSEQGYYVWVIRDPKDVFVSSFYFIRSMAFGPIMPSVQKWLDVFLSPDALDGSWAEHVKGGWEHRELKNVLFMTYEEMLRDLPAAVSRIADLIEVDLTPSEHDEVVRRASFDHMKSISHKFEPTGLSPPWIDPHGSMIRRGRKGSATELLSEADQRRIDDYWRAELERIDCDFPYDEYYGAQG